MKNVSTILMNTTKGHFPLIENLFLSGKKESLSEIVEDSNDSVSVRTPQWMHNFFNSIERQTTIADPKETKETYS